VFYPGHLKARAIQELAKVYAGFKVPIRTATLSIRNTFISRHGDYSDRNILGFKDLATSEATKSSALFLRVAFCHYTDFTAMSFKTLNKDG
jgi:hypothetical protein